MNHAHICQSRCYGIEGYDGSCCTLEQRDYIIGPIPDSEEVLKRVQESMPNVKIKWDDLFINYEEGKKLFPERPMWQKKNCYPAMRINPNSKRNSCVCYNDHIGFCQIYEQRSVTCAKFFCKYLQELFDEKSNK